MAAPDTLLLAALRSFRSGWTRYLQTVWALTLLIFIDGLTGGDFTSRTTTEADIRFLGTDIPRLAFSLVYGTLSACFLIWATHMARTLRTIAAQHHDVIDWPAVRLAPEVALWSLSPIGPSALGRTGFWLLAAQGAVLLIFVSWVHITCANPNDCTRLPYGGFELIGWFCAGILAIALALLWIRILPDLANMRRMIETSP